MTKSRDLEYLLYMEPFTHVRSWGKRRELEKGKNWCEFSSIPSFAACFHVELKYDRYHSVNNQARRVRLVWSVQWRLLWKPRSSTRCDRMQNKELRRGHREKPRPRHSEAWRWKAAPIHKPYEESQMMGKVMMNGEAMVCCVDVLKCSFLFFISIIAWQQ